jgi:transposase InsO family protein
MDITYLPMKRGFLYMAAVIDWHSRKILSFRLSNTMHTDFCIEAVNEIIQKIRYPRDHKHLLDLRCCDDRLNTPSSPAWS